MSDNLQPYGTQDTNPPSEPLTRTEQYLSAIAGVTPATDIPPVPLTRIEKYLNKIIENGGGGGGGGGDITSANVTAMTDYEIAEEADAIETTDSLNEAIGKLEKGVNDNETNISSLQDKSDRIVMDSNETTILYFQGTQPPNPHDGDCWINCSTTT